MGSFSISTWAVDFKAVCNIPARWTIKAGSEEIDGGPEGETDMAGIAVFPVKMSAFSKFVLVRLSGPVRRHDTKLPGGKGEIPASFQGKVTLWRDVANREAPLSDANIRLTPASRCPHAPR